MCVDEAPHYLLKGESMQNCPIIVIAHDENIRNSLVKSLSSFNVSAVPCATFCEAETLMLYGLYQGILVDLSTIIKAKAEEKIVACSLTGFFPTMRVKTMGTMIVPMSMAGDAKQDKSLSDFLNVTCAEFAPRRLRSHRRKEISVSTIISKKEAVEVTYRGFTRNISWGGLFIVDMNPERFSIDEKITVFFPEFNLNVDVIVIFINAWGQRKTPGIGVKFKQMDEELEHNLLSLLRSNKECDRDRLVA